MKRTVPSNTQTLAIFLVVGCVLLAGCSGWGGDGPTDDPDDGTSDDVEETNDDIDSTEDQPDASEDDESDEDDGENGNARDPPESEGSNGVDDVEHASPDDVQVADVTHMESEASLDHDEVTLSNTNDERPLAIGGWTIETDRQDRHVTIEDGTVIEPNGTHTIQFENGEKALDEDGGTVDLYDADGDHVGAWDHVGSPSAPPEDGSEEDAGYVLVEVVHTETDEGIEDATVVLLDGDDQFTGTTDGAGVTTVQEVPYGEYELTVEHDRYTDHSETITVDEDTRATIELSSVEANLVQKTIAGTTAHS